MTLVATVAIALIAGGVIMSLPWKETATANVVAASAETESVQQETSPSEGDHKEQEMHSAGVLASRSGQPLKQNASQPKLPYSEEDLYWMARVISSEARGESLEGQIAVGAVIMNRLKHPGFPKTIKGIIFSDGQFDPARNGSIYNEPVPSAVEAAKRALQGENPVPGALYFYNPTIATDQWIRKLRVIKRIDNHVFAAK
ncbi:N-acetylmuramoyl-L-alanine amidase [Effusibacillus lacus]|nr:N-acetylmuramoyl-L-alanine amidase [Effusibacillus lacus]